MLGYANLAKGECILRSALAAAILVKLQFLHPLLWVTSTAYGDQIKGDSAHKVLVCIDFMPQMQVSGFAVNYVTC